MSDRDEPEEPGGLDGAPFSAGAVRQRHHDRLEVLAHDLELAHALELHRLARQVLLRRHRVGEDVEQHGAAAGRVHAERDHVAHHRLKGSEQVLEQVLEHGSEQG